MSAWVRLCPWDQADPGPGGSQILPGPQKEARLLFSRGLLDHPPRGAGSLKLSHKSGRLWTLQGFVSGMNIAPV
jgi:hypothetical protein